MKKRIVLGSVAFAMGALAGNLVQPVTAESVFTAPEYVFKDQNGLVVGGLSAIALRGQMEISRWNPIHEEHYQIQLRPTQIFSEDVNLYYSNNDCTGIAYIREPADFGGLAAMRGSNYAIGRKAGATWEDSLVMRGSGAGIDNSSLMQSKYTPSAATPCSTPGSTTSPTVVATQVDDLSNFVRPFVAE